MAKLQFPVTGEVHDPDTDDKAVYLGGWDYDSLRAFFAECGVNLDAMMEDFPEDGNARKIVVKLNEMPERYRL